LNISLHMERGAAPRGCELSLPGLLLASAMNSATISRDRGVHDHDVRMRAIIAVAARSCSKLKVRFVYSVSLIACAAVACRMV